LQARIVRSRALLRSILLHIFADRNSKRIFIFLVINFLFMFVELGYGTAVNSLGLISDAGHMLFDCVALGIGLYASYVAKVKSDSTFTYGCAFPLYVFLSGG